MNEKLTLLKNLSDYCYDHDMVMDGELINKVLLSFKPLLENVCEICGGAMCGNASCPIETYVKDIDNITK